MYHIKYNHERNMPVCKYFQNGNCHYSDEKCWYIHRIEDQALSNFKCGLCGKSFNIKDEFMKHRKSEHTDKVKMCINLMQQ